MKYFLFVQIYRFKQRAGSLTVTGAVLLTALSGCDRDNRSRRIEVDQQRDVSKRTERTNRREAREKIDSVIQVNARLHRNDVSGRIDQSSINFLVKLAESDPNLVIETFLSDPKNLGLDGFDQIAEVMCRMHPDFVAKWLKGNHWKEIPDEMNRKMTVVILMNNLTQMDSSAALEVLGILPKDGDLYDSAMRNLFIQFGKKDANFALDAAKSRYSGKQLDVAIKQIARGQSLANLGGALKTLELLSDKSDRSSSIATIVGGLVRYGGYEKISEFVATSDSDMLGEILLADSDGQLFGPMLKNDLDAVKRVLDTMVLTQSSRNLFESYLANKVVKDQAAAFSYLGEIPDSPIKTSMVRSMFYAMSRKNIDVALEKLGEMDGDERMSALGAIARTAGSKGMDNVMSVAQRLDASTQESLISDSITSVCAIDFEGAMNYVDSGKYLSDLKDDESKSAVVQAVSRNYTSKDPEAAFKWIDSLNEASKPAAMAAYAMERGKVDPVGLSEQLAEMPQNETWRSGVKVLISQLRSSDPQRAAAWEKILDEK